MSVCKIEELPSKNLAKGDQLKSPSLDSNIVHSFQTDERVFVLDKTGMWLEGRILELSDDLHPEANQPVPTYKIHYLGWNKRCDEWLLEECILAINEENRILIEQKNEERFVAVKEEELDDALFKLPDREEEKEYSGEAIVERNNQRMMGFEEKVTTVVAQIREQMLSFDDQALREHVYQTIGVDSLTSDPGPQLAVLMWDALKKNLKFPASKNIVPGLPAL